MIYKLRFAIDNFIKKCTKLRIFLHFCKKKCNFVANFDDYEAILLFIGMYSG